MVGIIIQRANRIAIAADRGCLLRKDRGCGFLDQSSLEDLGYRIGSRPGLDMSRCGNQAIKGGPATVGASARLFDPDIRIAVHSAIGEVRSIEIDILPRHGFVSIGKIHILGKGLGFQGINPVFTDHGELRIIQNGRPRPRLGFHQGLHDSELPGYHIL